MREGHRRERGEQPRQARRRTACLSAQPCGDVQRNNGMLDAIVARRRRGSCRSVDGPITSHYESWPVPLGQRGSDPESVRFVPGECPNKREGARATACRAWPRFGFRAVRSAPPAPPLPAAPSGPWSSPDPRGRDRPGRWAPPPPPTADRVVPAAGARGRGSNIVSETER